MIPHLTITAGVTSIKILFRGTKFSGSLTLTFKLRVTLRIVS